MEKGRYGILKVFNTVYWGFLGGNGQEDESAPSDGQFFYDYEGIDITYETKYNVYSSEDSSTYDDNDDEDFLVDKENEIVEPVIDVNLFGISMDVPFNNIGVTNLVPDDVLEGEDVDVINADSFDSDTGNDDETSNYKRKVNRIEQRNRSRRILKLYKNDGVRIRARCDGKMLVFTMLHGTRSTGLNHGMKAGPSESNGPTTRNKKEEYKDYVVELKSTNTNITIKITVERNTDPSLPTRVFKRIYVYLKALKLGFRACRRDLLGLDGAFMKGPFPGQVLVAVRLDSNNGIYPLAYALIEAKTSSATNVRDFEKCMLELKTMNPKAHEWLNKIPAEHWAKSHFSGRAKSDLLVNNICEVFNGKIVRVRIMESIKKEAHFMKVQWNGANKYQVSGSLACWNMALNDQEAPPQKHG
ncbi:hypothetical protein Tco_1075442 [Tanacetum coccineum]